MRRKRSSEPKMISRISLRVSATKVEALSVGATSSRRATGEGRGLLEATLRSDTCDMGWEENTGCGIRHAKDSSWQGLVGRFESAMRFLVLMADGMVRGVFAERRAAALRGYRVADIGKEDGLHSSAAGYAMWSEVVGAFLGEGE